MTSVLAIGAIVVTFVLARVLRKTTDGVLVVALTLVLGGALGNLTTASSALPDSCAGTSSTSSRLGGGRCSTSPTRV
jgi:hypothetical protein